MTGQKRPDVRDAAAPFADEALAVLAGLMRHSASDQVRIAAARELLDRAYGKPRAEGPAGSGPSLVELIEQSNLLDDAP